MYKILSIAILLICSLLSVKGQNSNSENVQMDSIIPVFKFSENYIGLTLILWEYDSNLDIDKLLSRIVETDNLWEKYMSNNYDSEKLKLVETTQDYKLFKNKTLSDSLSFLLGREFFIYGEHGTCLVSVTDILFSINECITSFVLLKLGKIDSNIGNPLIATTDKIEISFEKDLSFEKEYNSYLDTLPLDYTDTIPEINFSKWNGDFLFYSDNFKWYENSKNCQFPSRTIVFKRENYFNILWKKELDLYGIPCD